jgi:hypothetical protein
MQFDLKLRNISWYNIVSWIIDGETIWFSKKHEISHGFEYGFTSYRGFKSCDRTVSYQEQNFYFGKSYSLLLDLFHFHWAKKDKCFSVSKEDIFFPIYEHLFEYIGTQFPPPSSLLYGKMSSITLFFFKWGY